VSGGFTAEWYNAQLAKRGDRMKRLSEEPAVEREVDLHSEIMQRCRQLGWLALHGSMAHIARRTPGEPDFVILGDNRAVHLIECKARSEKQTKEQAMLAAHAHRLGHIVHVVRNMKEFEIACGLHSKTEIASPLENFSGRSTETFKARKLVSPTSSEKSLTPPENGRHL
jgi:hypothetical protein